MSLSELAETDNSFLIEDKATGFADDITFRSPAGASQAVTGLYNAIGVDIDPGTGLTVPGSKVSVVVRLSSLTTLPDDGWEVEVARDGTTLATGYVNGEGMVDRTTGRVTFLLRGVTYG